MQFGGKDETESRAIHLRAKDGHHPIVFMQCGPIRFSLSAKRAAASAPFRHAVLPRYTDFQPITRTTINDFYSAITSDYQRNSLIVRDIRSAMTAGRSPLVLTGRTEHLNLLLEAVRDIAPHVFVLRDGQKAEKTDFRWYRGGPRFGTASFFRRETTSVKALTTQDSILSFWRCRFHGKAHCNNTLAVFIACMSRKTKCKSSTMLTQMSRCLRGCLSSASTDIKL